VRGDSNVGRIANNLVVDSPFAIGLALGEVQRPCYDANRRIVVREPSAKVLKVCPIVAVEAVADLGAHVAQGKGIVHGLLAPLGICRGDLVAAVIARAEVVFELGAELLGDADIFDEDTVFAVGVAVRERLGRDVLRDPGGVSRLAVVDGCEGGCGAQVVDGPREAILEDAIGIHKLSSGGGRDCRDRGYR